MIPIAPTGLRMGLLGLGVALALTTGLAPAPSAFAQDTAELVISVKEHKFDPAELQAPAGKPLMLRIKNLDPTPMEFESNSLRVEKVLTGNGEAVINIRPQAAGRYDFFDDFHASTTKGVLVVK
jgi:Cupredoxin-like domain